MAERKVLNKYYPPDWDPSKLPKTTKPKNKQQDVRLMLPMSIQCGTCGEYLSRGKKYNGRKEEVIGENYLGIKIYRLYFRCTACLSEITFKTDPKHSDYTVERGATRNFEPWKQATKEEEIAALKKEREEMGDNMKVLENRTEASKREMEIQDAIEEVKELNARAQMMSTDQLLGIHIGAAEQLEEEQIEALAAAAFAKKGAVANGKTVSLPDPIDLRHSSTTAATTSSTTSATATTAATQPLILKRLPDPVDFTNDDLRPPSSAHPASAIDLLAAIEVPDSPKSADSPSAAPTLSYSTSAASTASNGSLPVSTVAAPTSHSLLPLVTLVKKRKAKDDPEREKRKEEKRRKKEAKSANNATTTTNDGTGSISTPVTEPSNGLGGLLGGYDSDSD